MCVLDKFLDKNYVLLFFDKLVLKFNNFPMSLVCKINRVENV